MIKKLFIIICLLFFTSTSFASGNNLLVSIGEDRLSDNIERITILANPGQGEDIYGISLNISITNAEIIDFTPAEFMSIGTCGEGKRLASNKVCSDFATESGFRDGDELGYITVKWGKYTGKSKIEIKEKNYIGDDGKEFVLSQNTYTYQVYGGIDTTLQRTNLVPISLIAIILISVILIIYYKKPTFGIKHINILLVLTILGSTSISIISENNSRLSMLPETGLWPLSISNISIVCTNAQTSTGKITLTIDDSAAATPYINNIYNVQISTSSVFLGNVSTYSFKWSTKMPHTVDITRSGANNTTHYVRVSKGVANFSNVLSYKFSTCAPALTPPTITKIDLYCDKTGTANVGRVIITFTDTTSTSAYKVQVSTSSSVSGTVYTKNVAANSVQYATIPSEFPGMPAIKPNTLYYYKVVRVNPEASSTIKSFTFNTCVIGTNTPKPTATKTNAPKPTATKINTPTPTKTTVPTSIPSIVVLSPTIPKPSPTPTDDIGEIPPTDEPEPTFPPEDPTEEPTEIPALTDTPDPTDIAELTETPIPTVTDTPDVVFISDTPFIEISGTLVIPTPLDPVVCGPIDHNDDDKLNLFDFIFFSKVYRRKCSDSYARIKCGPKDTNSDGEIGIIDFIYFARHYYTRADSCKLTT
jgi:hypothetical protein